MDQWDWERAISSSDRTLEYLKEQVKRIYEVIKRTEFQIYEYYAEIEPSLPEAIKFIHAEELLEMYPDLSAKERENRITEKYGAVFIIGIGADLADGKPHDGRAPDYDDWWTPTEKNFRGLNGDILLWNPILNMALEISSMGIRVNKESLKEQLIIRDCTEKEELFFHQRLLKGELPDAIGGGIGQSRLCMLLLHKAHIGEIQSSIWPEEMIDQCRKKGIVLI